MYQSIKDLPIVCQLNLPEPALKLYRAAFNRAYLRIRSDAKSRYLAAQNRAWVEVRKHFARDPLGRWTPR
ncbi:MAG TPA: ChaB family protein [Thermoanaerobaculia bacterium]|jgi:cation transport regulator ChaB